MYIKNAEYLVKNDSKLILNKIEKREYNNYWQGNDNNNGNSYWQGNDINNNNNYWKGNNVNNKMYTNNLIDDNKNNDENKNKNWVNNNTSYWVDTNAKDKDSNNSSNTNNYYDNNNSSNTQSSSNSESNNYDYNDKNNSNKENSSKSDNKSNQITESKSNGTTKEKNISYPDTSSTIETQVGTNTLAATPTLISSNEFNNSNYNIPDNSNISVVDSTKDNDDNNLFSTGLGLILPLCLVFIVAAVMFIHKNKLFNNKENENNESSKNVTQNTIVDTSNSYSNLPSSNSILSREEMSYEIISTYQNIFPYTEKLHKDEATKPIQNL